MRMDDLELNLEKGSISITQALYVTIKTCFDRFSGDTQSDYWSHHVKSTIGTVSGLQHTDLPIFSCLCAHIPINLMYFVILKLQLSCEVKTK